VVNVKLDFSALTSDSKAITLPPYLILELPSTYKVVGPTERSGEPATKCRFLVWSPKPPRVATDVPTTPLSDFLLPDASEYNTISFATGFVSVLISELKANFEAPKRGLLASSAALYQIVLVEPGLEVVAMMS
jgi:hypothetical protein